MSENGVVARMTWDLWWTILLNGYVLFDWSRIQATNLPLTAQSMGLCVMPWVNHRNVTDKQSCSFIFLSEGLFAYLGSLTLGPDSPVDLSGLVLGMRMPAGLFLSCCGNAKDAQYVAMAKMWKLYLDSLSLHQHWQKKTYILQITLRYIKKGFKTVMKYLISINYFRRENLTQRDIHGFF